MYGNLIRFKWANRWFLCRQAYRQRVVDAGRPRAGVSGPRFRTVRGGFGRCEHLRRPCQPGRHIRSLRRRPHYSGEKLHVLDRPVPRVRGRLPASQVRDWRIGNI